jgi:hypothetical protein
MLAIPAGLKLSKVVHLNWIQLNDFYLLSCTQSIIILSDLKRLTDYSRTSLDSDGAFIASAINVALADEIKWPDDNRLRLLSNALPAFAGCIGHIDGTLCRILRPKIPEHKKYYNNRKSMHCFNNVIVIDHDGLFIYVQAGFTGSFP